MSEIYFFCIRRFGNGLKLARRRWWPGSGGPDVLVALTHLRMGATCELSWPEAVKDSWRLVGGRRVSSGHFQLLWWDCDVYERDALVNHGFRHLGGSAGAAQGRWSTGNGNPEALTVVGCR